MTKSSKAADAAADVANAAPGQTGPWVEVTCPSGPRRRAGLNFGPTPVVIDGSTLDAGQREALENDMLLTFRIVSEPKADPAD